MDGNSAAAVGSAGELGILFMSLVHVGCSAVFDPYDLQALRLMLVPGLAIRNLPARCLVR